MIDIGVNLTNSQFREDLADVLTRARTAGVTHMIVTGTDVAGSRKAVELCGRHTNLSCTAGVHPHDAAQVSEDWLQQLTALAAHPAVCAVGETGLDFNRNYSPPDRQREVFAAQLELAVATDMPLFIHDRDTGGEVLSQLTRHAPGKRNLVVHCFTGSRAELEAYLAEDYYIGITGWVCDPKRGGALRELVSLIPDERLLVETDAPFLLPAAAEPVRKRRNEPCELVRVIDKVAELRAVAPEELAALTARNARQLFKLPV